LCARAGVVAGAELEVSIMTADQVSKKQFHRGVSSRWRQSAKPRKTSR
jgi:hypothetical protein